MTPNEPKAGAAWQPGLASQDMEERMERAGVAESDRDEIRRMAEFLSIRKDKKTGVEVGSLIPAEMKDWLAGAK